MTGKTRDGLLLAVFWALVGSALWTVLPFSAPKANDLGYISACPFAPWSTLALSMVASFVWVLRRYFATRPKLD